MLYESSCEMDGRLLALRTESLSVNYNTNSDFMIQEMLYVAFIYAVYKATVSYLILKCPLVSINDQHD